MGELLLWWCLQDTGTIYPAMYSYHFAEKMPLWVRREMAEAATRRLLWFPGECWWYDEKIPAHMGSLVNIAYRRKIGNPLPHPIDPRGPRYGGP